MNRREAFKAGFAALFGSMLPRGWVECPGTYRFMRDGQVDGVLVGTRFGFALQPPQRGTILMCWKPGVPTPLDMERRIYRSGFTLMELLIVMLIITILAALSMVALQGAVEEARADRTRAIVTKIDLLINDRWEGYRTRSLPIRVLPGTRPKSEPYTDSNGNGFWDAGEPEQNGNGTGDRGAAYFRLMSLRELMRCELPERISDLCNAAELTDLGADNDLDAIATAGWPLLAGLPAPPALARSYRRKAALSVNSGQPWTMANESSECLYLIVSAMHDGDKNALDFFTPSEIGDTDGDGMREVLDGWGRPIQFLRWAPGFIVENGVVTQQTSTYNASGTIAAAPDPYDPVREDARPTYALRPLVFSGGRDGLYDINVGNPVYAYTVSPNDPFLGPLPLIGTPMDANGDGDLSFADNITNHWIGP